MPWSVSPSYLSARDRLSSYGMAHVVLGVKVLPFPLWLARLLASSLDSSYGRCHASFPYQ